MLEKCPGMFGRKLDSVVVSCPACGREVEIFTDEPGRRCRCGRLLRREALPRCTDWCRAAPECLGETTDAQEPRRLARIQDDPRSKECVEKIRQLVERKGRSEQHP